VSLIAVEALITLADPSTREALLERSIPFQLASRAEPGCIVYCFAADPCVPECIQVYELWESESALAQHFRDPSYHDMRALLGSGGLVSSVSRKHRIGASAPVYDSERRPTTSFD
jgi:quinol monooxygenase YgiN